MLKLYYKSSKVVIMKIAVISGASSGIGAEFVRELDNMCLDEIWLIARNAERLSILSNSIKTTTKLISVDLLKPEAIDNIKQLYDEQKPEIEYLVCSAGVGFNGPFCKITKEQINMTVSLNCSSLTMLNSISLPYLIKGAKIINIASGAGFLPQPDFAVYAASKAYVISLSRALGQELKKRSISVTAVCPGPVSTDFFSSLENVKDYKKKYLISPKKVAVGALKASKKGKVIYSPTISIKLVHLASKIIPTSIILRFYK